MTAIRNTHLHIHNLREDLADLLATLEERRDYLLSRNRLWGHKAENIVNNMHHLARLIDFLDRANDAPTDEHAAMRFDGLTLDDVLDDDYIELGRM